MSKAETCSCWYVLLDTLYNNIVVFDAYYILLLTTPIAVYTQLILLMMSSKPGRNM
jgi:hypothetical protein